MNLKSDYLKVLKSNQFIVDGNFFTAPAQSDSIYPHQWLWDSCFHSIIYSSLGQKENAKKEIRSLIKGQWKNGMLPHMIYWKKSKNHKLDWGTKKNTSSITQPPMVAYAVEQIYKKTKDKEFVKEVFDSLDKYYTWLHKKRSNNYLLFVVHPWETGMDDFVSWDKVYNFKESSPSKEALMRFKLSILKKYVALKNNPKEFSKTKMFNVKSLIFNTAYLRGIKSMIFLAEAIGSDRLGHYKWLFPRVRKRYRIDLYNKKLKLYCECNHKKRKLLDHETSSIFLPLFTGVISKKHAKKLVEKYLFNKQKFWANYPVPTVSMNDIQFQPNRYWRGSTWININWFIYKGLKEYHFDKEANILKKRTFELIKENGFYEYFNPLTGKGLGPKRFVWSGLIFDMK